MTKTFRKISVLISPLLKELFFVIFKGMSFINIQGCVKIIHSVDVKNV